MNYIKQTHTQILIGLFIFSSLLFVQFSSIDIYISSLFYDNGFYLRGSCWEQLLYDSVTPFLLISLLSIISLCLINKFINNTSPVNGTKINGTKTFYLILVLIIGPGIIVNSGFKNNFGRARPSDIIEFNGSKQFSPAFVMSDQCNKNCSFSSGHASGAFFALALAFLFRNRKKALLIAFAYGCLVSFARLAAGRHFFSDNVVSFFVMAITIDILYYLFFIQPQLLINSTTKSTILNPNKTKKGFFI